MTSSTQTVGRARTAGTERPPPRRPPWWWRRSPLPGEAAVSPGSVQCTRPFFPPTPPLPHSRRIAPVCGAWPPFSGRPPRRGRRPALGGGAPVARPHPRRRPRPPQRRPPRRRRHAPSRAATRPHTPPPAAAPRRSHGQPAGAPAGVAAAPTPAHIRAAAGAVATPAWSVVAGEAQLTPRVCPPLNSSAPPLRGATANAPRGAAANRRSSGRTTGDAAVGAAVRRQGRPCGGAAPPQRRRPRPLPSPSSKRGLTRGALRRPLAMRRLRWHTLAHAWTPTKPPRRRAPAHAQAPGAQPPVGGRGGSGSSNGTTTDATATGMRRFFSAPVFAAPTAPMAGNAALPPATAAARGLVESP